MAPFAAVRGRLPVIEWDIVLALVIGAFGFGYGAASRGWRKDIERLYAPPQSEGGEG